MMANKRKCWITFLILILFAGAFRISVAHWLANDAPDDGRVYAQMARNVLEQHVYSHNSKPPFDPSLIRLPGYPLFLASIYTVFGHENNRAVRIIQALIDTTTCALIALLAFYWQPDENRKRVSAVAAGVLAAVCPFTTIYAATILTEVMTNFLLAALLLAATMALRKLTSAGKEDLRSGLTWWCVAGVSGGLAVMMRPDSGLFLAAVGVVLVVVGLQSGVSDLENTAKTKIVPLRVISSGAIFSVAFVLVLVPWTVRNWRVFHVFQPLAPAHAEMPGEFVPRGYQLWVRTWIDNGTYVERFLWSLDTAPIDVEDLPARAFDSAEEKKRVAALLDRYNHPEESATPQPHAEASPVPTPSPKDESSDEEESDDEAETAPEDTWVEMTPEVDAGFAQIARERITQHPFRYYVWLPIKRARAMWFDTHSQYWPFEGTLLPLDDLDYKQHQQVWLPLFAGLTAIYTLLGLAGAGRLWRARTLKARQWVLLAGLMIILRLALFSFMENPEPRYLVEFFPILSTLGGIAIASLPRLNTFRKFLPQL